MKKVFSCTLSNGNTYSIHLLKKGDFKMVVDFWNNKKQSTIYKDITDISIPTLNKEFIKEEIEKNINCCVYDVYYTTQKTVKCGFGGYRIATKNHYLKNIPEFELKYYSNKKDYKDIKKDLR